MTANFQIRVFGHGTENCATSLILVRLTLVTLMATPFLLTLTYLLIFSQGSCVKLYSPSNSRHERRNL